MRYQSGREIALVSWPYYECELVQACLLKAAIHQNRQNFANRSLSENILGDKISDLTAYLDTKSFIKLLAASGESTDITHLAKLAIFIRGVHKTLTVKKKFLGLVSIVDTTTVNDIFISLVRALDRVGVEWAYGIRVDPDGVVSIIGEKKQGL